MRRSTILTTAFAVLALAVGPLQAADSRLQALIEAMEAGNPALRSAAARSESERQRAVQERALPEPELLYRYFARTPETRVGPQTQALELSQRLPWAGKRRLQRERAVASAAGAAWDVETLRLSLLAELKQSYAEIAYLQEALAINEEERRLLERFEGIALKRYATGEGIQQSVVRVQTEISRLHERRIALHERLAVELRRLAELIGRPGDELALPRIELAQPTPLPEVEKLESVASSSHPGVRALESRIEADRLWSRRRALERRPDFRVGLGYTLVDRRDDPAAASNPVQDDGQDIVAVNFGVNIPLWRSKIRAGIDEANESVRTRTESLSALRNRLRREIRQSVLRLGSIQERSALYREVIVPQAYASLASAEAAYTTNRQGFLDLLDAERILFRVRLDHRRLVSDYWIAHAMLEQSVGRSLGAELGS